LPAPTDIQALAEKAILDGYAPSGVLVNDKYEILHFVGRTEKYLVPPTGKPSFNILTMARPDLKYKLTTALNKAFREKTHTTQKGVRIKVNGSFTVVDITVGPLSEKGDLSGLMLVVFEDKRLSPSRKVQWILSQKAKSRLRKSSSSNRIFSRPGNTSSPPSKSWRPPTRSSNRPTKRLQSVNEELQSTNEELETSKEELAVHQRGAVHGQFGASKQGG
jgi:two-component system CheB/CheR fusion protein